MPVLNIEDLTADHVGWTTSSATVAGVFTNEDDGKLVVYRIPMGSHIVMRYHPGQTIKLDPPDPWAGVHPPTVVMWGVQTTHAPDDACWASDTRSSAEEWIRRNASYHATTGAHVRLVRTTGWEVVPDGE